MFDLKTKYLSIKNINSFLLIVKICYKKLHA